MSAKSKTGYVVGDFFLAQSEKEMSAKPAKQPTKQQIVLWLKTKDALKKLQETEMKMRKMICDALVEKPKEGANSGEFEEISFTLTHKINRTIDEAALDAVFAAFPENSDYRKTGYLIDYKPSLVVKNYKDMPEKDRKHFEQALKITDGAPALEFKNDPRLVWGDV